MSNGRREFFKYLTVGGALFFLNKSGLAKDEDKKPKTNLVLKELQKPEVQFNLETALFNLRESGKGMSASSKDPAKPAKNVEMWSDSYIPAGKFPMIAVTYKHRKEHSKEIDGKKIKIPEGKWIYFNTGNICMEKHIDYDFMIDVTVHSDISAGILEFSLLPGQKLDDFFPKASESKNKGKDFWSYPNENTVNENYEKVIHLNKFYQNTLYVVVNRLIEVHNGTKLDESILKQWYESRKKLTNLVKK